MSAIAHGYALSASALERANFYATNKDWAGMWEHLHQHEIPERFRWTGYAIVALATWLRKQRITLPRNLDPAYSSLWASLSVVLLCTQAVNLQGLRNSLSALDPSASELAAHWRQLMEDNDQEASTFMLDGWRWLNVVISRAKGEDWLLIVVG